MSSPAQYIKSAYLKHGSGVVKKNWNGLDVISVPITNAFGLALGCRASVVPVRQFSETRYLDPDEDSSTFYLFDGLEFSSTDGGGGHAEPASCTVMRGLAEPRVLPDVDVKHAPRDDPDLRDRMAYAYLQRSLEDEAEVLLRLACGGRNAGSDSAEDARQAPPRINGATGEEAKDPPHPQATSALTCRGLDAAKKKMACHGLDADRLVCYTTTDALHDLSSVPEFVDWNQGRRGMTAGCMREYDGILLVARPSFAPRAPGGNTGEAQASCSVMFVPDASFGLVFDDLVTVNEAWQDDDRLRFSATHRAGGVLKDAGSVCCLLHA